MSRRTERLNEAIREEVSKIIISDLNDPRMGFVTVTKVRVSPDAKEAKVYVSILGEDAVRSRTMHGLIHARGFIQEEMSERLPLRFTPRLKFFEDESVKQSVRISKILYDLQAKGELPAREEEEDAAPEPAPEEEQ